MAFALKMPSQPLPHLALAMPEAEQTAVAEECLEQKEVEAKWLVVAEECLEQREAEERWPEVRDLRPEDRADQEEAVRCRGEWALIHPDSGTCCKGKKALAFPSLPFIPVSPSIKSFGPII